MRLAKIRATQGDYSLAADLVNDLIADDDCVGGVMAVRVAAVLSAPLTFEHGVGRSKKQPVKALEALEDWWAMFSKPELSLLLLWGFLFGIGLGQLVYRDEQGELYQRDGRIVPRLKTWSPRHLRRDPMSGDWYLDLAGKRVPITPGDGEWIMLTPHGGQDPTGFAPWRSIALHALMRAFAILDSGRRGEVSTILVAAGPPGTKIGNENRDALAKELRALGRDAAVVFEGGLDLKNLSLEGSHKIFESQWDHAEKSIAIRLVGQNLTTHGSQGTYGATAVQELVRQDVKEGDADTVGDTLHDQGTVPWSLINWGSADLAPWPVYNVKPAKNVKLIAEAQSAQLKVIADAKALSARVDVDAMLEQIDGIEMLPVTPSTSVVVDPAALPAPADPAPSHADTASP